MGGRKTGRERETQEDGSAGRVESRWLTAGAFVYSPCQRGRTTRNPRRSRRGAAPRCQQSSRCCHGVWCGPCVSWAVTMGGYHLFTVRWREDVRMGEFSNGPSSSSILHPQPCIRQGGVDTSDLPSPPESGSRHSNTSLLSSLSPATTRATQGDTGASTILQCLEKPLHVLPGIPKRIRCGMPHLHHPPRGSCLLFRDCCYSRVGSRKGSPT